MCVAAIAWHAHPDWQLVVIGNRDEFHERPAAGATGPVGQRKRHHCRARSEIGWNLARRIDRR